VTREHTEQRHLALYEYLLFFWKKKKLLITIPIVFVLGALLFSLFQKDVYEGKATVYVGGVTTDSTVNPDLIKAEYSEGLSGELKSSFQVFSPGSGKISLQLSGGNQQQVEKEIHRIANAYLSSLNRLYNQKYQLSSNYAKTLSKRIEELQKSIEFYRKKSNGNLADTASAELLIENQKELSANQERLQIIQTDLLLLDKPVFIEAPAVSKQPSNLMANLIVAFLGSVLLTSVILIFWKYWIDAEQRAKLLTKQSDTEE
jgi:capsular polysaccharide biosynthesis protein